MSLRCRGIRRFTIANILVALAFSTLALPAGPASGAQPGEYQIKAVFLFNFVQFAQWPPASFRDAGTPISIGVLGEDPFGAALEETLRGESIDRRQLIVHRSQDVEKLKSCHLLFVSKSESARLNEVFELLGSAPVLTVSDIERFTERGGMIGFYLERNRVRFEIAPATAQQRGVKLSSQLLSLGRIRQPSAGRQGTR